MAQKTALILTGRGRYADPWHDHAAQSHALASIVCGLGLKAEIKSTFVDDIPQFQDYDLVIVNASRLPPKFDYGDTNEDWIPFHEALRDYARAGKPLLAFHTAISAFEDSPYWPHIVGGRWIRPSLFKPQIGMTTHHPRIDRDNPAEYVAIEGSHPIVSGLDKIHAIDEQYTFLFLEYGVQPFLKQQQYNCWHANGWVNEQDGLRLVFHALGHTPESILSADHRDLLEREIKWLAELD